MSVLPEVCVGIVRNTRSSTITDRLVREALERRVAFREIELATCRVIDGHVVDAHGVVAVTHLAPGTTYGEQAAAEALAALERCGVVALNSAAACSIADDKLRTAEVLSEHGVPQPAWVRVEPGNLSDALAVGVPLVLKRPAGALGMWNRLVQDAAELDRVASELLTEGGDVLLAQQAVTEALGTSVRVVVLDGVVLAATKLQAAPGEWRSNGALGSHGSDLALDVTGQTVAAAACAAVQLRYAGVDLIASQHGWLVLEVNAGSPFDGAERRTGRNIAWAIIDALTGPRRV